jgi:ethanolamine utilization protein EutN
MRIGTVTGAVVAPVKHHGLSGCKFLLVTFDDGAEIVAVDDVGAGTGSRVIVVTGSHAMSIVKPTAPVDAVIVGMLDHDH